MRRARRPVTSTMSIRFDSWVPARHMVVSPMSDNIYAGVGPAHGGGSPVAIAVLDAASLRVLSTIAVNQQFENLAISNDGGYLYAPSMSARGVLIIDTTPRQNIEKVILDVPAPVQVLVAP